MESRFSGTMIGREASILTANKLIRNTYMLLSMALLFSALMAGVAMMINMPPVGVFWFLIGHFGLFFLINKFRDSALGVAFVFVWTGFLGATLGPIISYYLSLPNGDMVVMQALGGTAVIFLGLSAYAMTTRKDFSYMGGFLAVGILIAFLASLGALFFNIPALSLAVSAAFLLISSGFILYQTSLIVNGGETNYVMATVALFVSIYNIFVSLLSLLGNRD